MDIARRPATSLAELAVIWQRDLRQPVIDAPPEKPKPQAPEPKLAIDLLGSAVEADARYGNEGHSIDGYVVLESLTISSGDAGI